MIEKFLNKYPISIGPPPEIVWFYCKHNHQKRVKSEDGYFTFHQCSTCGCIIEGTTEEYQNEEIDIPTLDCEKQEAYEEYMRCVQFKNKNGYQPKMNSSCKSYIDNLWHDWYNQYLQTNEWKERRQSVIKRENGLCQGCQNAPIEEIHHLTYKCVGIEPLFQLVGLCSECHKLIHDITDIRKLTHI